MPDFFGNLYADRVAAAVASGCQISSADADQHREISNIESLVQGRLAAAGLLHVRAYRKRQALEPHKRQKPPAEDAGQNAGENADRRLAALIAASGHTFRLHQRHGATCTKCWLHTPFADLYGLLSGEERANRCRAPNGSWKAGAFHFEKGQSLCIGASRTNPTHTLASYRFSGLLSVCCSLCGAYAAFSKQPIPRSLRSACRVAMTGAQPGRSGREILDRIQAGKAIRPGKQGIALAQAGNTRCLNTAAPVVQQERRRKRLKTKTQEGPCTAALPSKTGAGEPPHRTAQGEDNSPPQQAAREPASEPLVSLPTMSQLVTRQNPASLAVPRADLENHGDGTPAGAGGATRGPNPQAGAAAETPLRRNARHRSRGASPGARADIPPKTPESDAPLSWGSRSVHGEGKAWERVPESGGEPQGGVRPRSRSISPSATAPKAARKEPATEGSDIVPSHKLEFHQLVVGLLGKRRAPGPVTAVGRREPCGAVTSRSPLAPDIKRQRKNQQPFDRQAAQKHHIVQTGCPPPAKRPRREQPPPPLQAGSPPQLPFAELLRAVGVSQA